MMYRPAFVFPVMSYMDNITQRHTTYYMMLLTLRDITMFSIHPHACTKNSVL